MATALDLIENFEKLDIKVIAVTALRKNSDSYSELNAKQMQEGKRSDNRKIGEAPGHFYLSLMYARDKQRLNSLAGFMNPDLRLTGAFQDGIYMNVKGEDIVVDSTDSKTEKLVEGYGVTIFGLGADKKTVFVDEFLQPEFQAIVEKQTGLKFV